MYADSETPSPDRSDYGRVSAGLIAYVGSGIVIGVMDMFAMQPAYSPDVSFEDLFLGQVIGFGLVTALVIIGSVIRALISGEASIDVPSAPLRQPLQVRRLPSRLRYDILARDGFTCRYCGATATTGAVLEVDHRLPYSLGGSDHPDNLVTACRDCNRGKSNRHVT